MTGTQYWSGTSNHCTVPGCVTATVTIATPDVTVTVQDTDGTAEVGLSVYVFDDATYTGYNGTTNSSGQATFTLPEGDYRFRADKNGTQFWSGETNHCTVPGCASAVVTTTIPLSVAVKDTHGTPEQGLKVYAFDGTSYTGYNKTTNASGLVTFTLPMGDYRFRADKNGTHFWSGETNHCTIPGCTSTTVTTTIPVVVTVEDSGANPEAGLSTYVFDGATYTGYNGTTDEGGLVTMTLPMGGYRFRADKDGEQYWSGASNHCTVPGCTAVTITVGSQAMRMPAGGLASVQEEPSASSETELLPDPSYRPPGLAALLASLPAAPSAESGQTVTVTRVITQAYDPLGRLVSSGYSTGESFGYAYDAAGNREVFTSTTPLSGTLVTTYTFDAANRLTARSVSDGRSYTYDWSARGQLLAEWTQGYPVRTFTYDGAGRLVEATVFTLTTKFTYNGLGARVAVEVVGHDTTIYTLDYANGNAILAETTLTDTVQYLYGRDCLGELRDGEWLYYHNDGSGLVRQGTDEAGHVVSAWLFDPDGTVLEGPEGPVSHLVCGGVYDWSTGLIYKDGRYFDPLLGIWLALAPLVVVQSWRGRKQRGWSWVVWVVLCLVGVSGTLTACGACEGPSIDPPSACTEITSFGQPLGDNAVFVGPTAGNQLPEYPEAMTWDASEKQVVETILTGAINDKYAGLTGFGSLDAALAEFGVSTDDPIVLVRRPEEPSCPGAAAAACKPYVYVYNPFFDWNGDPVVQTMMLTHEMAHYWDDAHNRELNGEMREWINWGETAAAGVSDRPREDFAEAVRIYFWQHDDQGRQWTDDMGRGLDMANDPRYGGRGRDGLRFDPSQLELPVDQRLPSAAGTEQVYDRYDYLECRFTGNCLKPLP